MIGRIVLFGLAATRLTRALQFETVGRPFQDRVERFTQPVFHGETELGSLDLDRTVRRERLHDFLTCPHCLGFWITLGIVLAWRFRPARPIIEALAAATILSAAAEHYPNFTFQEEPT